MNLIEQIALHRGDIVYRRFESLTPDGGSVLKQEFGNVEEVNGNKIGVWWMKYRGPKQECRAEDLSVREMDGLEVATHDELYPR